MRSIAYTYEGTGDTSYGPTDQVPTNAGTYKVTATFAMWLGWVKHDPLTSTLTITKATPSVTSWPAIDDIEVGQTLTDASLVGGSANVAGAFSVTGATRSWDQAGTYQAEVTFTPTKVNYEAVVSDAAGVTVVERPNEPGSELTSEPGPTPTRTIPVSSEHGTVRVAATVSGTTATLDMSDAQIAEVIADHAGTVIVDASSLEDVTAVTLPSNVVARTHEAQDAGLSVVLPWGSVSLGEAALTSVATGQDVTISVVGVPLGSLTQVERDAASRAAKLLAAADVEVPVGGVPQTSFAGTITVSLPYAPSDGEDKPASCVACSGRRYHRGSGW